MRSSRPYVQLDPAVIEQARQMDLVRAEESFAHGEGRQEIKKYKIMERCVRHHEKSTKCIEKSET